MTAVLMVQGKMELASTMTPELSRRSVRRTPMRMRTFALPWKWSDTDLCASALPSCGIKTGLACQQAALHQLLRARASPCRAEPSCVEVGISGERVATSECESHTRRLATFVISSFGKLKRETPYGRVHRYVDPREEATVRYFERHFCVDAIGDAEVSPAACKSSSSRCSCEERYL